MPALNTLLLAFETPALPSDTFDVADFQGEERISQPYRFHIRITSKEPDISFSDVFNQQATLSVAYGEGQMIFHGTVIHFEQGNVVSERYVYEAILAPRLWLLSLNFQSRVFLNQKVDEIIKAVLEDAGLTSSQFQMDLATSYPVREYRVQYQESDLNFINRLCEKEGIRYHFDMTDEGEKVVFTDKPQSPDIPGESQLVYNPGGGLQAASDAIRTFISQERAVTGKVFLKDYNYRTPETVLEAESQINTDMVGTHYEYGQHFGDQGEGNRLAEVRNQEIECQRRVMTGHSGYLNLYAGHTFSLKEHFRPDFDSDYLLTHIKHFGQQGGSIAGLMGEGAKQEPAYRNEFTCIPAEVVYRSPRVTPVPKINGVMQARIKKPSGDYAHLDEEGRYRSKIYFDIGDSPDHESSHWIRMKQAYSGPNYGIHFPNHAETEMLFSCIDGNPDRPIALGTAPNPTQKSPSTSENKMQNTIRTWSGNQMIMDDTKEEEQVLISTPAINSMLFDDKDDRIFITTTNKHQIIIDDKNKHITIQTTDGHFMIMDDMNKKINLQSKDGHRVTINDEDELMTIIDSDEKNQFQIDIGNKKLTIETKEGDIDILAPEGNVLIKAKTLETETTGDTTHKAANIEATADMDYTVKATNVTSEASMEYKNKGMNVTSEASMAHKNKGLNVTSEAGMMNDVKGTMIGVKASAINTISGALVKIN